MRKHFFTPVLAVLAVFFVSGSGNISGSETTDDLSVWREFVELLNQMR